MKNYTKKVAYNADEERQCNEVDFVLLVAYDAPLMIRPYSSDPSVLRLKYYVLLISRRLVWFAIIFIIIIVLINFYR